MGNHDFDPAAEPDYRIPPGGGVPWRDLSMEEEHRPPERDVEITGIETMVFAGNFDWGIVKVETDAGVYGIGEAFLAGAAVDIVHRMEPFLVGENPLDIARLVEYQSGWGHRERAAFAGIEAACWDVKGKVLDVPVYELLGGKFRDEVRVYCDTHGGESLGAAQSADRDPRQVYTPESYAEAAREVVDDGFDALKFDLDVRTHADVDTAARRLDNEAIEHKVSLVEAVREEIGYDVDLGMDLHWNFTVETATRIGRKLEPYDLAWLEDPVPPEKVDAHRRVTESVGAPIMTGENLVLPADFVEYATEGAFDVAAPDINKCGGVSEFLKMAAICDVAGVPMSPHNISSPVGTMAGVHAAAAIPNFLALEYHARDVPWWEDLVERTHGSGPIIADGTVDLPEGPGWGVEIVPEVAERYLTDGSSLVV